MILCSCKKGLGGQTAKKNKKKGLSNPSLQPNVAAGCKACKEQNQNRISKSKKRNVPELTVKQYLLRYMVTPI